MAIYHPKLQSIESALREFTQFTSHDSNSKYSEFILHDKLHPNPPSRLNFGSIVPFGASRLLDHNNDATIMLTEAENGTAYFKRTDLLPDKQSNEEHLSLLDRLRLHGLSEFSIQAQELHHVKMGEDDYLIASNHNPQPSTTIYNLRNLKENRWFTQDYWGGHLLIHLPTSFPLTINAKLNPKTFSKISDNYFMAAEGTGQFYDLASGKLALDLKGEALCPLFDSPVSGRFATPINGSMYYGEIQKNENWTALSDVQNGKVMKYAELYEDLVEWTANYHNDNHVHFQRIVREEYEYTNALKSAKTAEEKKAIPKPFAIRRDPSYKDIKVRYEEFLVDQREAIAQEREEFRKTAKGLNADDKIIK